MPPPAPTRVTLFFDVISPYTVLAYATLVRYRAKWNLQLELKPLFVGSSFAARRWW